MRLTAELDLADALDLQAAVTQGAETLKALGSPESLDARRAAAVGEMARSQLSLNLHHQPHQDRGPAAREVVLHVHLTPGDPVDPVDPVATLERGHALVTPEQVRAWCGQSLTRIKVQPVLDLNAPITCDGYQPSTRLRDQVTLRDRTCVFPWCTRNARSCDLDHIVPWEHGGPTSTDNLAALCRRHHRLKTHGRWRYQRTGPAAYTWTSPHGHTYLRDATGTGPITGPVDPPEG